VLLVLAGGLLLALALGFRDRLAALGLLMLSFVAVGSGTLPVDRFPLLLLALHAWTRRAPYGSLEARGRLDPGGDWRFRDSDRAGGWLVLAIHTAVLHLASDRPWLAVAVPVVALGALPGRLRPAAWLALLCLGPGCQVLGLVEGGGTAGLLLAALFAAEPSWIPGLGRSPQTVFYDGDCGLCHRFVRFLLAEDADGARFRFAPLESEAFAARRKQGGLQEVPDSIVVGGPSGELLFRSAAVAVLLEQLGGLWRVLGTVLRLVPQPLRDAGYDGIARLRKRLFRAPDGACPLLPPRLRERFDVPEQDAAATHELQDQQSR